MVDYQKTYSSFVRTLLAEHPLKEAMDLAVGGHSEEFGPLELQILIEAGLKPEHYLIDVGCGSGRLTKVLPRFLRGRYLGTDVVQELLSHVRSSCERADWRFELVRGITIPERDGQADMVAFFSVFTHLLHEDSYRYLQEAYRVLRPGGRVVFSFLEFLIPTTWAAFESMINARGQPGERPHNQFLSRDAIQAWSEHTGFRAVKILDGDKPQISTSYPHNRLGQSVCILQKPG